VKKFTTITLSAVAALGLAFGGASAASAYDGKGTVPGQMGNDGTVTGHYTEDYQCLDGAGTVTVNYRGDFGGDPHLNDGWITNQIKCDSGVTISYLIVSSDDPRHTGNPSRAIWGSWEIVKETVRGMGNLANLNSPTFDASLLGQH